MQKITTAHMVSHRTHLNSCTNVLNSTTPCIFMDRVQKIMSQFGYASRRKCEELIAQGRVQVNGKTIKLGDKAENNDKISVDGELVNTTTTRKLYLMLNKPAGVLSTTKDNFGGQTITDLLPLEMQGMHLYHVGRLDKDAEGLLILTNDGDFAQKVMHPSHEIKKTYRAYLTKPLTPQLKAQLEQGVRLEDGFVKDIKLYPLSRTCVDIKIHVGRHKIVKRIFESVGIRVMRLIRTKVGPVLLAGLRPGEIKEIPPRLVKALVEGKKDGTHA